MPSNRSRGCSFAVVLLALAAGGCSAPRDRVLPPDARPDGERGHGTFETPWGIENIDYVWRQGERVYEGDLVLSPGSEVSVQDDGVGRAQEALLSRAAYAWERDPSTGVVRIPYAITNTGGLGTTLFDRTRDRIRHAMDHWETYARRPDGGPLFRFVERSGETRWAQFQVKNNGGVCFVNLNDTGKTRVDSDPACRWQTFVHEIGHVLTFRHEQKRSERPAFVTFHPERTNEDPEFRIVGGNTLGTPYDSYSIMHYPSCMFALSRCNGSRPGAWVLERIHGTPYIDWWSNRAVGDVLSPTDVCGARTLYGLSCTDSAGGADGGVGGGDAGVGSMDGGVPSSGIAFPVTPAVAGMLQSHATGATLCAAPSTADAGALVFTSCDSTLETQRWGVSATGALRNEGSMLCAEPAASSDGAPVDQTDCRPDDAQRWRFGAMELVNGATGTCMTVPAGEYGDGQMLVHEACTGGLEQRFAFVPDTHELKAQGWCLTAGDASGALVTLGACDGSPEQRWIETNGGLSATDMCMKVRGGPTAAPDSPIEMTSCSGAVGQMWGLRGHVAYVDDELCLAAAESDAAISLASCAEGAPEQTLIWWPRSACAPLDCADLGASCGTFDDGCGTPLSCGDCPTEPGPEDGGVGEMEECVPSTCADVDMACGTFDDGCGGTLDCGSCASMSGDCGCAAAGAGGTPAAPWVCAALLLCVALVRRRR